MLISALILGATAIGSIGAITMAASKDKKDNKIIQQPQPTINAGGHVIQGDFIYNDNSKRNCTDTIDENKLKDDIVKDIRNIFKEQEINMQDYIDDIDMILAKYK